MRKQARVLGTMFQQLLPQVVTNIHWVQVTQARG